MTLAEILAVLLFAFTCGALMGGFPVALTLAGSGLIFGGLGLYFDILDFGFLTAFPSRIFGTMTNQVLLAVPLFVFMGVMLERSKVAEDLLDSMGSLFGSLRGGLGISVVLVGALLAASTGIVGATVVTMGLLSLPTMLRRGYDKRLATGVINASGTLGQIIPPSIVLILLGDQISIAYQTAQLEQGNFAPDVVSVADLFAGALIPGIVLVGLYICYVIWIAATKPGAAPAIPAAERRIEWGTFLVRLSKALVPPILLIVAVLGSILAGIATATEAAGVGAVGASLLAGYRLCGDGNRLTRLAVLTGAASLIGLLVLTAFVDLRVTREDIGTGDRAGIAFAALLCGLLALGLAAGLYRVWKAECLDDVVKDTTTVTAMVFAILIGAALFSLVFRGLGGDAMVHEILSGMPGDVWGALILVMLVMFLLGFFLDFIEITFVVVPLVAPVLLAMGLDPVWLGVLMAMNLQTSFLTPPFGFALFYLRGVAPPEITTGDIYRGALPFVAIQIGAVVLIALVPALATWLPNLLAK